LQRRAEVAGKAAERYLDALPSVDLAQGGERPQYRNQHQQRLASSKNALTS
jgi:hypothetical protein